MDRFMRVKVPGHYRNKKRSIILWLLFTVLLSLFCILSLLPEQNTPAENIYFLESQGGSRKSTNLKSLNCSYRLTMNQMRSISYPLNEICSKLFTSSGLKNATTRHQLVKIFNRFNNLDDFHAEEDKQKTADVRFVIPINDLRFEFVLLHSMSSYISGRPVEFLLFDNVTFNPYYKWKMLKEYISKTNLKDEDVIVVTDADTAATGYDFLPTVKKFLRTTARSAEEMNVELIRTRQQSSPIIFPSEKDCFRTAVVSVERCEEEYRFIDQLFEQWVLEKNTKDSAEGRPRWIYTPSRHRNAFLYLNSGGAMGRVWALKEFLEAIEVFETFRLPPPELGSWNCDQSVIGTIFVELQFWELKNALKQTSAEKMKPYGLTSGLISIDYKQEFLASMHDRSSYYWNGTSLTNEEATIVKTFNDFVNDYTERRMTNISPTGVPLAPLNLTCLKGSNRDQYENFDLLAPQNINHCDRTEGMIDISIDTANAVPLMFHYNGFAKVHQERISLFLPWKTPLLVERHCSVYSQLEAILSVLHNAPMITVWYLKEVNMAFVLNSSSHLIGFEDLCKVHRPFRQ